MNANLSLDMSTATPVSKSSGFFGNQTDADVYSLKTNDAATERLYAWRKVAKEKVACLTPRQHQVMQLVLDGLSSKVIASDLGISQRTVENHRASIMKKTGSKSIPALARLALTAALSDPDELLAQHMPQLRREKSVGGF